MKNSRLCHDHFPVITSCSLNLLVLVDSKYDDQYNLLRDSVFP
jgi:hypothetical protein